VVAGECRLKRGTTDFGICHDFSMCEVLTAALLRDVNTHRPCLKVDGFPHHNDQLYCMRFYCFAAVILILTDVATTVRNEF